MGQPLYITLHTSDTMLACLLSLQRQVRQRSRLVYNLLQTDVKLKSQKLHLFF